MAELNCTEIIENDDNGDVVKAGAIWNEQSNFPDGLRKFLSVLGIFLMLFAAWIMLYASMQSQGRPNADGKALASIIACITGFPGLILFLINLKRQPKRSILFRRDGAIESPFGIVTDKAARTWANQWSHEQIREIEAIGTDEIAGAASWSVAFIYAKGDTIKISGSLYREEARKVAVMLKRAWEALHPVQSLTD